MLNHRRGTIACTVENVKHLVREMKSGTITAKCGAEVRREDATVWYTEVECLVCRPYEYVKGPDGELVKVSRGQVVTTPPRTKVMRRRSQR